MDTPTERPIDQPAEGGQHDPAQRIVVGVDGSVGGRAALAWALTAAAVRGAELVLVSAFPVEVYVQEPLLIDERRLEVIRQDTAGRARRLVTEVLQDRAVSAVAGTAAVPVRVVAVPGPAAPVLVHRSATADLLVVGSRGRGGVRSTILGSVALHCAVHAGCPVVVVHPSTGTVPGSEAGPRVVVGLDDSQHGRAALAAAVAEGRRRGAVVDAVLAYEQPDHWSNMYADLLPAPAQAREQALRRARALVAGVAGRAGDGLHVSVAAGPAGEVLVRRAAGAELLVVGTRSRSTLAGMVLGSVALHCVVHAPCPLEVVRPISEAARTRPAARAETPSFG